MGRVENAWKIFRPDANCVIAANCVHYTQSANTAPAFVYRNPREFENYCSALNRRIWIFRQYWAEFERNGEKWAIFSLEYGLGSIDWSSLLEFFEQGPSEVWSNMFGRLSWSILASFICWATLLERLSHLLLVGDSSWSTLPSFEYWATLFRVICHLFSIGRLVLEYFAIFFWWATLLEYFAIFSAKVPVDSTSNMCLSAKNARRPMPAPMDNADFGFHV